ncbi:MAG: PKD domain-containing protein [Syntrophomonadaceae bacterium]
MPKRCSIMTTAWVLAVLIIAAVGIQAFVFPGQSAAAPTTSITMKKVAADGTTELAKKTVDYRWLMNNLPVMGDGVTHYYHQGPVFADDADEAKEQSLRWNPAEDTNIESKDMGAVKGTNVKDLCGLVGGMTAGDTLKIKARDGLVKSFAYKNIYRYSSREGPIVLCWYKDGQYPDSGYSEGMRLVWLADTSVNPWGLHVFGNWDWHEAAEPRYWYFYQSGNEKYPTTTGLSIQYVSELTIVSAQPAPSGSAVPVAAFTADVTSGQFPLTVKFNDQSANSPTSWAWDFDNDGKIDSSLANPSFTYEKDGIYTVRLTVQNSFGSADVTKQDYIKVGPGTPAIAPEEGPADVPAAGETDQAEKKTQPSSLIPFLLAAVAVMGIGTVYLLTTRKKGK